MNAEDSSPKAPEIKPGAPAGKPKVIVLLLVACVALAAVVWLLVARRPVGREVIVEVVGADEEVSAVYTSEVIDAIKQRNVEAQVGHRYKVVVEDESREGTAGIARIGGLVTFIKDARVGDILVVEVTRLKQKSAEARIVRKIETVELASPTPVREPPARPRRESPVPDGLVQVGSTYSGTVEEIGAKGDGIVRIGGKVIFVPNTAVGEEIVFVVTSDKGRFAVGERTEDDKASSAKVSRSSESMVVVSDMDAIAGTSASSEDVQEGRLFDVVVVERDKKTPDVNGVARIGGLVVFVPNSQPGDEVRIRITERRPRFAFSEVLEHKGQLELKQ